MESIVLIAVLLGTVLVICWIMLPFALIGLKPLVRELIRQQERTNEHLARIQLDQADRQKLTNRQS